INTVPDTPGCDHRASGACHLGKAHDRGDAPAGKILAKGLEIPVLCIPALIGADALDRGPGRPAPAAGIDGSCPCAPALAGNLPRDPAPGLLDDHRGLYLRTERGDRGKAAGRGVVPLRLDGFLEEIEVDGNRVGADHPDGFLGPGSPVVAELHSTEICDQECMGCLVTDDRKRVGERRVFKGCPLGAHAHAEAETFGDPGKAGVCLLCFGMAAGHCRYKEGRREPVAEKPGGQVDRAHVAFRQCIVDQPDITKACIAGLDLFFCADTQVVELARRREPFLIGHFPYHPLTFVPPWSFPARKSPRRETSNMSDPVPAIASPSSSSIFPFIPPVTSVCDELPIWRVCMVCGVISGTTRPPSSTPGTSVASPTRLHFSATARYRTSWSPETMQAPRERSITTSPWITGTIPSASIFSRCLLSKEISRPLSATPAWSGWTPMACTPALRSAATTSALRALTALWVTTIPSVCPAAAPLSSRYFRASGCPQDPAPWTTTIPVVGAPAMAAAMPDNTAWLTRQSAPLSVITLPPSLRMMRSDILLLPHSFGVDTGHNRPCVAGLDRLRDPVPDLLCAEGHHAAPAAGPGDLRAERPGRAGSEHQPGELRVPDAERIEQRVVHVHVPAQFLRIAQVVDCREAHPFDCVKDRVDDLRVLFF